MTTPTSRRVLVGVAASGAALCAIAGCGGGSSKATNSPSVSNGEGPNQAQGGFNRNNIGSASGKVTAVSGQEAKVTTSTGTTVIAWSASQTRFTASTSTTRSAIKAGDCVSVESARIAHSDATNGQTTPPSKVTAKAVTITSTSGCNFSRNTTGGFGGPGGPGGPGGSSSSGEIPRPTGTPSFRPGSGGGLPRNGFRGGFGGAIGTVKSVAAGSFVVNATFGNTTTTVTTTSATTYTSTGSGSASDVATGKCLSAFGTKASGGVIDAFTVTISAPVDGKCSTAAGAAPGGAFGGFGPGAGGPPAGAGTTSG